MTRSIQYCSLQANIQRNRKENANFGTVRERSKVGLSHYRCLFHFENGQRCALDFQRQIWQYRETNVTMTHLRGVDRQEAVCREGHQVTNSLKGNEKKQGNKKVISSNFTFI